MSIVQLNGACPAILEGISEVLKTSNPQNLVTPIGATQSLLDADNTRPVTMEQMTQGGKGHTKPVRIMFKQRALTTSVKTSKDCDPGVEKPIFEDLFNVSQYRGIVIKKSEASIRQLCDAYSELVKIGATGSATGSANQLGIMKDFADDLLLDLDPLRQAINEAVLTSIAANIGSFADGVASPKSIAVIKSATDHSPNLAGFNIMKQEIAKLGYGGMPIVFGAGNFDFGVSSLGYGAVNSGGTDFAKVQNQLGLKYYKDFTDLTTPFSSANAIITYLPSSLQFVTFNEYVGSFAAPIGNAVRGTFPDPILPGVSYDIKLVPSECDEEYDLHVGLYFDVYAAPTTLFATGDRLEGVNGVVQFNATTVS